jgi:MoxR-like ATPase
MTTNTNPLRSRILAIGAGLEAAIPGRKNVVRGLLAAVLSGSHAVLLGPPGTAKSLLTRLLGLACGGAWFEKLMTRFTTPEELFGPVSLKGLEQDRFVRVTTGTLAECHFGFVDEIFKANSAILNSLLTAMNERVFHNPSPTPIPLISLFGASNEMPESKELEALWDRFALRFDVRYLSRTELRAVLMAPAPAPVGAPLTLADLTKAQAEVRAVVVPDDIVDLLLDLRDVLAAQGIVVSDRRWRTSLDLIRASAWLAGQATASREDLAILADSLWREPKERTTVAKEVGKLSDMEASRAKEALDIAREAAAKVAAMKVSDPKKYLAEASEGRKQIRIVKKQLEEMRAKASPRTAASIDDDIVEVDSLVRELTRVIAEQVDAV